MLQVKFKSSLLDTPGSALITEPIRLPRRPPEDKPWTIKELEALADDEASYELVRGDIYMMTPATPLHGRYASRLTAVLVSFAEQHDLGEVYTAEPGFILQSEPEPIVRSPDVAFVRKDRLPPVDQQEGFWPLAPDLVIKIISPSESADAVQEKVNDYLAAGTQLIWLVYPKLKSVVEHGQGAIRQLNREDSLEGGVVLPGFNLSLNQLFRD